MIYPNFNLDENPYIPNFLVVFNNFEEKEDLTKEDLIFDFYEILAFYINSNMLLSNFEFENENDYQKIINQQQEE